MNWDLRHRKSSLVIRLLLAVWITVVVVVLCATGRWWGLVFVVPLVLDLYLPRRILAKRRHARGARAPRRSAAGK
jgi:1,4-dihydroxy-2-naphthoate octaprenyltransferase